MNAYLDPTRIVVGIDGSAGARAALAWAVDEARLRHAPIDLVHAWRPIYRTVSDELPDDAMLTARIHGGALLAAASGHVRISAPELTSSTRLIKGRPSAALMDAAAGACLLVVGARGLGGFPGMRLGSVGLHVVAHAPCSTVVVRTRQRARGPIIVGVDGSTESKRVLASAFEEASVRKAPLVVTSVLYVHPAAEGVPDPGRALRAVQAAIRREVESLVVEFSQQYPDVETRSSFPIGYPAEILSNASASAQLLVVGSHGGGGFDGMGLGSISHAVAHEAHCPVMVVREDVHPR